MFQLARLLFPDPASRAGLLMIAAIVLVAGCAKQLETGVLLVVDAEPSIYMDDDASRVARSLDVYVYGGGDTPDALNGLMRRDLPAGLPGVWPVVIGFSPRDGDASRVWGVKLDVLNAAGRTIVVRRLRGGFAPGRVIQVDVKLEEACRDMACGDALESTCRDGACGMSEMIDPASAPDWDGRTEFTADPTLPDAG